MADCKEIKKALKTLGLGDTASIAEIKDTYRKLSLKYHPDKCSKKNVKKCEEKFKEINNANEFLIEYCLNYRFSFNGIESTESQKDNQVKDHLKRFYDGWWGDLNL